MQLQSGAAGLWSCVVSLIADADGALGSFQVLVLVL
jgi:hypothetical protein